MWEQGAYPVANKIEYIRERCALRKSLKGLKYKEQKNILNVCKVHKENQNELEKCTTSIVCVSYEFDLQQQQQQKKTMKVELIFYHRSKEFIVP